MARPVQADLEAVLLQMCQNLARIGTFHFDLPFFWPRTVKHDKDKI